MALYVGGCSVTAANLATRSGGEHTYDNDNATTIASIPTERVSEEVSTGTTILAVSYDGGVVLGADSRVTTGTYVSNRASDKITPLFDGSVYLCRSGSAADTQIISDYGAYIYIYSYNVSLQLVHIAIRPCISSYLWKTEVSNTGKPCCHICSSCVYGFSSD